MSSKTTNFNLHKIDLTDAPPDITVLNQNWDTIDAALADAGKVLIAEYGVTTKTELEAAYNAGKAIYCYCAEDGYIASLMSTNGLWTFAVTTKTGVIMYFCFGTSWTKQGAEFVAEYLTDSGNLTITLEDNKDYYWVPTSLNLTGADVNCHGVVKFDERYNPTVTLNGFKNVDGDDVLSAKASEVWEFSCESNRIIWKNWGVES